MRTSAATLRMAVMLLCLGFFSAVNLFAQASGSLHGAATDPSGARVVKATVTVQAADGTTSTAQTGADGSYAFPQLAPGSYTITVTAQGLALAQPQVVTISAGRATAQNLALIIAVEQQQVTVSEEGAGLTPAPTTTPTPS